MKAFKSAAALALAAVVFGGRSAHAASAVEQLKAFLAQPADTRGDLAKQPFATAKLTKDEADAAKAALWDAHVTMIKADRQKEWDEREITIGDKTLKLKAKTIGQKPKDGWNLFISMHGGGGAEPAVNDSQWENQIKLPYNPEDSLYVAPRAPTNTWNLWHESHIDKLFARLIEDAIVLNGVDPNHVYIMGYSAGGDGVYQLAPRMADELAAASMMAGHPNDASPLGLRDLPFTIHVGADDTGYKRNEKAAEWKKKLDDLQAGDPKGYVHEVRLHEGRSHWMNMEDKVAVDWMLKYTRNPIPDKIVWNQGNVPHDRFYWLAVPAGTAKKGQQAVVTRDGQTINIEKAENLDQLTVRFDDRMVDLGKPVTITMNGKQLFKGELSRTIADMDATLTGRGDPQLVFTASTTVTIK